MSVRPSVIVLPGVNMIPIAGAILFDSRVFDILMLHQAENVAIGAINVLRAIVCQGKLGLGRLDAALHAAD